MKAILITIAMTLGFAQFAMASEALVWHEVGTTYFNGPRNQALGSCQEAADKAPGIRYFSKYKLVCSSDRGYEVAVMRIYKKVPAHSNQEDLELVYKEFENSELGNYLIYGQFNFN
jgi:hypothetical protein